ncbi:hypothetical protein ACOMHN_001449 [Nucella lapillus]
MSGNDRRPLAIPYVNSFAIHLKKLKKEEERFNNFINKIEAAHKENVTLNNKDCRKLIVDTCDAIKDQLLSLCDSWGSNSPPGTPQQSPPLSAPSPVRPNDAALPEKNDPNVLFDHYVAYANGRRRNAISTSDPASSSSLSVTLDQSDVSIASSDPINAKSGQSLLDDVTGAAEPAVKPEDIPRGAILSTLQRMGQRLMRFFRWLLIKIKEVAQQAWNKVCEAFAWLFNSLRSIGHCICGRESQGISQQQIRYSSVSYDPLPVWQGTKYHAA